MREPYGILVEFISRYNCGGGFWWDSREGFWNSLSGTNFRPAKQWHGNVVEVDKDRGLLGNFQEGETKVKSKDHPVQGKHFESRKSFSGVGKHH